MSYELYKKTMKQLTKTLSHKFDIPMNYSNASQLRFLEKDKKWQLDHEKAIIPLFMNEKTAGCIQIQSKIKDPLLNEIYDHVQWTLHSLEKIFKNHGVEFSFQNDFPIFIPLLSSDDAIKVALDLYEKSEAVSFIHFTASVFNPSFFSEDMKSTLILISNMEDLSQENQEFLSDYLTKNEEGPLVIFSSVLDWESLQKKVNTSLMQCLNSIKIDDSSRNVI